MKLKLKPHLIMKGVNLEKTEETSHTHVGDFYVEFFKILAKLMCKGLNCIQILQTYNKDSSISSLLNELS